MAIGVGISDGRGVVDGVSNGSGGEQFASTFVCGFWAGFCMDFGFVWLIICIK